MAFDLVIFDCDGVLIDSELLSVRADIECLAACGVKLSSEELIARYTGISLADMVADLETRRGCRLPDFAARHRLRLEALFEAELQAMAGVAQVLDALPCRSCVASSATPERLHHALSLVGLYERFAPHVFSAAMVTRGKPAPDLFLYAARRMKAAPQRCLVVEDSLPGIAACRAAGMAAIGFTGGCHCPPGHAARLAAAGARWVVDGMAPLGSLLAQLTV